MFALFGGIPLALLLTGAPRWAMHVALWCCVAYAARWLSRQTGFSWRRVWHGDGWPRRERRWAVARFLLAAPLLVALVLWIAPERFLSFPRERTGLWLVVMALYPLLSALPQELVFRSFFTARYAALLPRPAMMIGVNAFWFGFAHIMFLNALAPLLCVIGSVMFSLSYRRHRALKWVALEHAAYGCLLFTLGLGRYFFAGNPP